MSVPRCILPIICCSGSISTLIHPTRVSCGGPAANRNFIDVDQRPSSLDDEEQQHRMQQYAQKLSAVDYLMVDGSSSSAAVAAARIPSAGSQQLAAHALADDNQQQGRQSSSAGKLVPAAALLGASLREATQLTQLPAWVGSDPIQPSEEQVRTAFALLRPTESLPAKDAAVLQDLSKQLRSALASSFPQLVRFGRWLCRLRLWPTIQLVFAVDGDSRRLRGAEDPGLIGPFQFSG